MEKISENYKIPSLKESIISEAGSENAWNRLVETSKTHPIIARALKEGLYKDSANALSGVQATIVPNIYPNLFARKLLRVVPTVNAAERFHVGKRGYVLKTNGVGQPNTAEAVGRLGTPIDINANLIAEGKQSWDETFREDFPIGILDFVTSDMQGEVIKTENEDVVTLLNAITATDLAGGAEQTITNGAPTWAQILAMIATFEDGDYPDVCLMGKTEFFYLFQLDQFLNGLYDKGNTFDIPNLSVYNSVLRMTFIGSSISGVVTTMVNSRRAGAMVLRSDLSVIPWTNTEDGKYGLRCRERYGMGIVKAGSVARADY